MRIRGRNRAQTIKGTSCGAYGRIAEKRVNRAEAVILRGVVKMVPRKPELPPSVALDIVVAAYRLEFRVRRVHYTASRYT